MAALHSRAAVVDRIQYTGQQAKGAELQQPLAHKVAAFSAGGYMLGASTGSSRNRIIDALAAVVMSPEVHIARLLGPALL